MHFKMLSAICFNLDQYKILSSCNGLTIHYTSRLLTTLEKTPFENIVGKGENAGNQHISLFPHCCLSIPERICFSVTFILSSANAMNFDQSENLSFGRVNCLPQNPDFLTIFRYNPF